MVKPIVQLDRTGCGIASAAALAGLSYSKAKAVAASIGIAVHDTALWSDTALVRRLLNHVGIRTGARRIPFRSWQALPDQALLAIKWHREQGRPSWHWVVFVRQGGIAVVLDSKRGLRTNRRTDFGRMRPKWYLSVTPRRERTRGGLNA